MERSAGAPAVPEVDERVARPGGRERLHTAARGKIIPYVRQPEDLVPGRPLFFATAIPFAGVAAPVLVESHEGGPTEVEGNPQHPASIGRTTASPRPRS